jgi:integrase
MTRFYAPHSPASLGGPGRPQTAVCRFDAPLRVRQRCLCMGQNGPALALWNCFWYDTGPSWAEVEDLVLEPLGDIPAWFRGNGRRRGQPLLIGPDGRADPRLDAFFSSRRMTTRAEATNRKYAFAIRVWLNFLLARGPAWDRAGAADVEAFKFWRRTDDRNPLRVQGSTFSGDVAALCALYDWCAPRFGVANPIDKHTVTYDGVAREVADVRPDYVRAADVKWLTPDAYRRWRDVGLLGLLPDGSERARWRPRCEERDLAFVEGLWGTGLRLQEWASVLACELPADDPARGFYTCQLGEACAKGRRARRYWMPRRVLTAVGHYQQTHRAAAVRRARSAGVYDRLPDARTVVRVGRGGRLVLRDRDGREQAVPVGSLPPRERARLLVETEQGVEPAVVWLNENGLPRAKRGWYRTFDDINARVARTGLAELACTPHMARHSFALRWYAVGRLVWEHKLDHLDPSEARDFRYQFGSVWDLVKTMLGHRDVRTTITEYLEPFRSLDIELLLEQANEESVAGLVAALVRGNPHVRIDPLAGESTEAGVGVGR